MPAMFLRRHIFAGIARSYARSIARSPDAIRGMGRAARRPLPDCIRATKRHHRPSANKVSSASSSPSLGREKYTPALGMPRRNR